VSLLASGVQRGFELPGVQLALWTIKYSSRLPRIGTVPTYVCKSFTYKATRKTFICTCIPRRIMYMERIRSRKSNVQMNYSLFLTGKSKKTHQATATCSARSRQGRAFYKTIITTSFKTSPSGKNVMWACFARFRDPRVVECNGISNDGH
jgi:hypothetical protein